MQPLQSIVPAVLADLVRRQPASAARTTFAWSIAAGPALARAATVEARDRVLLVTARDALARERWNVRLQTLRAPTDVTSRRIGVTPYSSRRPGRRPASSSDP